MEGGSVSEVEARFSKLRRSLDDAGYLESFGSDSLRLVEHLYNDLVKTTTSLQDTLGEYAHYKKIAGELESGVLPFKEENVRLCKENSQLRIGIARALEDAEDKARDPLSRLRDLEDENNDLKLLVSQFAERVKKAEIESLEKSKRIIKLQEKDLTPSVVISGKKGMSQPQTMQVDYFVPEACPQCIRLRNYVEYGKNSDRNPKTVDYIKLADSRIEALQLQLRSFKNMEKEHMSMIVSLKNRVDTRDSEIEKLRDLIKVRAGGDNIRNGKDDRHLEIELKSAEMKLQVLQLRNMELEEKLKKSICNSIPSHFGERNLANIFLEKELDKYPSHDKMTLLEKLYYLEQQLSNCCKEKAILQRKIEEYRLKHQSSTRNGKDAIIQTSCLPSDMEYDNVVPSRRAARDGIHSLDGKMSKRQLTEKSRTVPATISTKKKLAGARSGAQNATEFKRKLAERSGNAAPQLKGAFRSTAEKAPGLIAQRGNQISFEGSEYEEDDVVDLDGNVDIDSSQVGYGATEKQVFRGKHVKSTIAIKTTSSHPLSRKDATGDYPNRLRSTTNASVSKPDKSASGSKNSFSGSGGVGAKKPYKNVRISEGLHAEKVTQLPVDKDAELETGEDSSVDFMSSDEDSNMSLENANGNKPSAPKILLSKGKQVPSKGSEQQQPAKKSISANLGRPSQSRVSKQSRPLGESIGSGITLSKSKSALGQRTERTTDDSNDRVRPIPGRRQRDNNAKVKSSVSDRRKGEVSSSVISTAARVEDFEGASHEEMSLSEEGEQEEDYVVDYIEGEEEMQDYEGENFERRDYIDGTNLPQSQKEGSQPRTFISGRNGRQTREPHRNLDAHRERNEEAKKLTSSRTVGGIGKGKPTEKRMDSRSNVEPDRSQDSRQTTQYASRTAAASHSDSRSRPKAAKDVSLTHNIMLEDDGDKSEGSAVSYYDEDEDDSADIMVGDQLRAPQTQLHQPQVQRYDPRTVSRSKAPVDSELGRAATSSSDSRLLQTSSLSGHMVGNGRDEIELYRGAARQPKPSTNVSRKASSIVSTGHASQVSVSDAGRSHGISAVQEPSLLSISEFEKESSDVEAASNNKSDMSKLRHQTDKRVTQDPSDGRFNPQARRHLDQDFSRSQLSVSSIRGRVGAGAGDQPQGSLTNPYLENMEKNTRPGDREMTDMEFGRGRVSDGGTVYGTASDSSQSRGVVRDAPGFPIYRKSNSQMSQEFQRFDHDKSRSDFRTKDQFAERSHSLRSVGVNTEESRQFGLSWDAKVDDSQEKRQLLDKIASLQRKMDELHTESSRHQLKSFELQGELERTTHMLQVEKQERESATSELRRLQDRNSEASARLLMGSSFGSDAFRRGTTPMEMEREIGNLRAALASLDRDKDEMRVELDRKDEKLARVLQESSHYMDEISQLKLRLKNSELQISHTGESAKEQNREVEFLKRQLENTRRDLEKIIRERDDAQKELHKISGAHAKGQLERRGVESELELKSKEADDLRKQVQRYIDEVRRIEELLLDKEEEMDMLIQHYRSLTVENSNLEVQRTNLEREASSIRDSVKDAVDQNIGFKTQLASQNALVQSLEEEIQRFTQQISKLENQLGGKTEKEEMLAQDVKASKDLLYRLEVQMDKLKLDLADSESKRKQLEVENAELAAHIASLENRLQDETDRHQQLETLVANSREKDFEHERSALNISRERDELAEKLTSLQQRSESLNSEVSRYRLKSIELQNELDRTRRQLDTEKRDRDSAIAELRRAREQLHSSSANYLLKSALGSSGLQSDGSMQQASPSSGSALRQNLGGEGLQQRGSREQSPFTMTPNLPSTSDFQMETPPNATSTTRREEKSEELSPSVMVVPDPGSASRTAGAGGNDEFETWDSPS